MGDSGKPVGLKNWFSDIDGPDLVLSVGDNYVNDIEPALKAGAEALYIDRHTTDLGSEYDACYRVSSIGSAMAWLSRMARTAV
jgi:FMN phosphatase YigB (HAD superfamily)